MHRFTMAPCSSTGGTENSWSAGDWMLLIRIVISLQRGKGIVFSLLFLKGQGSEQSQSQWCIEMAEISVPLRDKYCK